MTFVAVVGALGAYSLVAGLDPGYGTRWGWLVLGLVAAAVAIGAAGVLRTGRFLVRLALTAAWIGICIAAVVGFAVPNAPSRARVVADERPLLAQVARFPGSAPGGYRVEDVGRGDAPVSYLNPPSWYTLTRVDLLPRGTSLAAAGAYYETQLHRRGRVSVVRRGGDRPDPTAPLVQLTRAGEPPPLSVVLFRHGGRLVAEVTADTSAHA